LQDPDEEQRLIVHLSAVRAGRRYHRPRERGQGAASACANDWLRRVQPEFVIVLIEDLRQAVGNQREHIAGANGMRVDEKC
jgi:hypothetical protein